MRAGFLTSLFISLLLSALTPRAVLAEPRLEASLSPNPVPAGQSVVLMLEVQWEGPPSQYAVYPPTVSPPASIQQAGIQQTYQYDGHETRHQYAVTLVPSEVGTFVLGTVTVEYRDPAASAKAPPLEAGELRLQVTRGGLAGSLGRLLLPAALVGAGLGGWAWVRRRRERKVRVEQTVPARCVHVLAQEARAQLDAHALDATLMILEEAVRLLPSGDHALPPLELLEADRMRRKYGGQDADAQGVERWVRALEDAARAIQHESCNKGGSA